MRLLSFDVDGTLWCGHPRGPVTETHFLERAADVEYQVVLTGNWMACPHHETVGSVGGYWRLAQGGGWERKAREKHRALERAAEKYPDAVVRTHVGDEAPDRHAAARAGWTYMTPDEYVKEFQR